ncbi:MAG: hypothetical protein P8O87_04330 [Crocinitomicaceae bacterium]|nr:hypothetical protein [Crocinitomicaceae bacterium]
MKRVLILVSVSLFLLSCNQDGPYKEYHDNNQLKEEGTFLNGKKEGAFKIWDDNSNLIEYGVYKEDKKVERNKAKREYFRNGVIKSEKFINQNNQFTGIHKFWHDNGVLRVETPYKNGVSHGRYKYWNYDGELTVDGIDFNGEQVILFMLCTDRENRKDSDEYTYDKTEYIKNGGERRHYQRYYWDLNDESTAYDVKVVDYEEYLLQFYVDEEYITNNKISKEDYSITSYGKYLVWNNISKEAYNNLEVLSEADKEMITKEVFSYESFSREDAYALRVRLGTK